MPKIVHALLCGIVAVGLAIGVIAPAPSAAAIEVKGVTLSAAQWKAATLAVKARNSALNASGSKMNYRKMKIVFGTKSAARVSWRRQMAAGFRQAGGRIVYISKAENAAVERVRKSIYQNRLPHRMLSAEADSVNFRASCRGLSGTVVKGNTTWQYLNSCEVVDILWAWGGCVAVMGAISHFAGEEKRVKWPAYAIGAWCGYQASIVGKEAQKSEYGAVVVRTQRQEAYQPYPGQVRYSVRIETYAQ